MCSGDRVIHTCCGFAEWRGMRRCSIISPNYPVQHRVIGLIFRTTRLCRSCGRQRRREERHEVRELRMWQERAKALIDYWQGRRPWPRTDEEIRDQFNEFYLDEQRLHPWVNHGVPGIDNDSLWHGGPGTFDELYREGRGARAGEGVRLWQEMLDRQADIDRTGRAITEDDRRYTFRQLIYFPTERERSENHPQSETSPTQPDAGNTRENEGPRNDPESNLENSPGGGSDNVL